MVDTLTMAQPDPLAIPEELGQAQVAIRRDLVQVEAAVAATLELAVTIHQAPRAVKVLILVAVRLRCTIILPLIIMHFIPRAASAPPPPPLLPPPTCHRA